MTGDEFAQLLSDFTLSAESGDGARFARHFTEDAVYHDYIYGAHKGRADIAHMMQNLFATAKPAMPGRCRASPRKSRSSQASRS
jgi:ketosteroid isomerase-like protein